MTVLIFPSSPADGELYPPDPIPGVNQYQWNAATTTWELIIPQGFTLTVSPNCGLELTGSSTAKNLDTTYNTLVDDEQISVLVGGAQPQPASVWKEKNLVQVFDTILFPELFPTYTLPEINLIASLTGYLEIGESVSLEISVIGTKNDAGEFSEISIERNGSSYSSTSFPTIGAAPDLDPQFGYANDNNPNQTYTFDDTDAFTVVAGEVQWQGVGEFQPGLPLTTSEGNEDTRSPQLLSVNAPQLGGSIESSIATIEGIYPYFWGKSVTAPTAGTIAAAIASGSEEKVLEPSEGTIAATFDAAAEYIWFAHPASYTEKTRWYNTPFNQSIIETTGFIAPPITQSVNSPDGFWSAVPYKIYISNYATNTLGSIELRNS